MKANHTIHFFTFFIFILGFYSLGASACEVVHPVCPEDIIVTGQQIPASTPSYGSSFTPSPAPVPGVSVDAAVENNSERTQAEESPEEGSDEKEEQCMIEANAAEQSCIDVYSNEGNALCSSFIGLTAGAASRMAAAVGVSTGWVPCQELKLWAVKKCGIHGQNLRQKCN